MKILVTLMLLIFAFSSCQKAPVHSSFHWNPYSKQAIEESIAGHKPMVIDFYADWCPICHELDDTIFSLPQIQAKLAQVTALRVDMTDQEDPAVQKLAEEYQIEGLPTVVFLDSQGHEIDNSRVIGFVTPHDFSQSLALLKIFK